LVTITVCIGSSCFKRGADGVVSELKRLIAENGLENRVVLKGSFCMDRCTEGTTVKVEDTVFVGVVIRDVPRLFRDEVLTRLQLPEAGRGD
jgi:NADH:ubiquinone oxidoreductase subunit E